MKKTDSKGQTKLKPIGILAIILFSLLIFLSIQPVFGNDINSEQAEQSKSPILLKLTRG
ncbi:hypothetical protein [Desulforamulus aeronauticus]|uniref:Uncharacterized protein n=1 Tax=Desulforamulus aeronauticus DSM 10349 TaxID=1121421 RepID=A0A1M6S1H9_9FIRM|nr:hypothetical protein [Desulforamulus aeronauticus]SHK38692.1 hypothetical protein SAMN02745123_01680 [Desulforamulus aeronauticus DSM 10349]